MKIYPKFLQNTTKYLNKNTAHARYNRHLDAGTLCALGTGVQIARFSSWQISDIGITSMLASVSVKNFKEAVKDFIALKPIRERALAIKKNSMQNFTIEKQVSVALNNKA